jgi:hypothetical protein
MYAGYIDAWRQTINSVDVEDVKLASLHMVALGLFVHTKDRMVAVISAAAMKPFPRHSQKSHPKQPFGQKPPYGGIGWSEVLSRFFFWRKYPLPKNIYENMGTSIYHNFSANIHENGVTTCPANVLRKCYGFRKCKPQRKTQGECVLYKAQQTALGNSLSSWQAKTSQARRAEGHKVGSNGQEEPQFTNQGKAKYCQAIKALRPSASFC